MTDQFPGRITRRSFLKAVGITTVALGSSCLAGYGYIFYIEPRWPSIERIEILISNLPRGLQGLKIVVLICGGNISRDTLKQILTAEQKDEP